MVPFAIWGPKCGAEHAMIRPLNGQPVNEFYQGRNHALFFRPASNLGASPRTDQSMTLAKDAIISAGSVSDMIGGTTDDRGSGRVRADGGVVPWSVTSLTEEVLKTMFLTKLKAGAVVLLASCTMASLAARGIYRECAREATQDRLRQCPVRADAQAVRRGSVESVHSRRPGQHDSRPDQSRGR
jgi:hypothetical protein